MLSNIQTNVTQISKFALIVNTNTVAMPSHKNTKRQGELAQCIKSVGEGEKNNSEGQCETGVETVATDDDDIGSEEDDYGDTKEEGNEVEDVGPEESHSPKFKVAKKEQAAL